MYSILFFSVLFIISSLILAKLIHKNSNLFIVFIISIFILYFFIAPNASIKYALDGAKLFVIAILPTTFPFMVMCNLLIAFDGIKIYSKILGPIICKPLKLNYNCSFAIVASMLCGYPLGAKYSTWLYKNKLITLEEFKRLINIASNIGPLFLVGAVGTALLSNTYLGYLLLFTSYLSIFFMGFITLKKEKFKTPLKTNNINLDTNITSKKLNIGEAIKDSIQDALNTTLLIAGYVIIFSVIINILKTNPISSILNTHNIKSSLISGLFLGSIEVTNGCNLIASSPNLNTLTKLCIISFLSSFGGLSVIAQTSSFFQNLNISTTKYFMYKLLQGIISIFITAILYLLIGNSLATVETSHFGPVQALFLSPLMLFLILTIILLVLFKLFYRRS
ncbi:sporulation integral membrane protein YlbJ [Clostridium cavendishii DSM 21758]|uniref:Sporulation integral membrane protein YlbJ n=1 Tax=Clostridium cavendishii DSM 21758 TaxID=1121302 RepID=A0A1M6K896_9CLOT|nr:sporulation integral membrane protein YlbJ [Clostridium cavendishii]SHJ55067.1 sporulation integral membrane protein YlbJ [Clostridium cavendishii DSM 21758]